MRVIGKRCRRRGNSSSLCLHYSPENPIGLSVRLFGVARIQESPLIGSNCRWKSNLLPKLLTDKVISSSEFDILGVIFNLLQEIFLLMEIIISIHRRCYLFMILFNILDIYQLVGIIVLILGTFSRARNKRVHLRRITFDTTIVLSFWKICEHRKTRVKGFIKNRLNEREKATRENENCFAFHKRIRIKSFGEIKFSNFFQN